MDRLIDKPKTACFTGHREIRKSDTVLLHSVLSDVTEKAIQRGYLYFGAGGARGFDTLAAQTVMNLKKVYPFIHLILILPFENAFTHELGWNETEIKDYQSILQSASKIVCLRKGYQKGCYYQRDRRLVDYSSLCICYQYKNTGGTAYTTRYAKQRGISVINCASLL